MNISRGITAVSAHKENQAERTPTSLQEVTTVIQQNTKKAQKILTTAILATTLLLASASASLPANAGSSSDYGALTDEQKAVAEAWRIVDNNFIDRTFNQQDWFKVRQEAVKKKYTNMNEAQVEIERLVSTLGDKYTRYLPPAKYRSIVDSATGTLAGVGVEISFSLDKESGKIIVADTEPTSPASIGTYICLFFGSFGRSLICMLMVMAWTLHLAFLNTSFSISHLLHQSFYNMKLLYALSYD
jgi:C-terminal processing protease CtpA/Prc